jgi:type II secretory pathway component GspD/PulD (secretin)
VLGDIPYLGQFFRYDSRKRGKTNLIVFLRPVILRDAAASPASPPTATTTSSASSATSTAPTA